MKKVNKKEIIILISLTIVYFIAQTVVPYIGVDDYYAHSNLSLIDGAFKRGIGRALQWNMRIGEIIFFTIGCGPKIIYNIMISFFFAYFLFLMKKYSTNNYENKLSQYILYYFLIISFMPILIDNFFKMSDSCNHLTGTCFILTVLYPLVKYDKGIDIISNSKVKYNLIIFIGFLAGMSSESNSIFILIYLIYIIIKNFIKNKKIVRWHIFTFITTLSGYMLLIFCSSTQHRVNFFHSQMWLINNSLVNVLTSFLKDNKYYLIFFATLLITYIIINLIKYKKNFKFDKDLKHSIFLLTLSIVTVLMFIFAPYYINRGVLLLQFLLLINIVNLINLLLKNFNKKVLTIISIVLLVISLIDTCNVAYYFYKYRVFDKYKTETIQAQIEQKNEIIEVPLFHDDYKNYIIYGHEIAMCTEEIVKQKYKVDYDFIVECK